MATLSHKLIFPTLIVAAAALLSGRAEGAEHACDRRVLPRADTLSVEAAARAATGGKLREIHVAESCITGTTTSVTLTSPNPDPSSAVRHRWEITCERERSTWYKRGGWKCDTPELRPE